MSREEYSYTGEHPSQHIVVASGVEYRKVELYASELLDRAFRLDDVERDCPSVVTNATAIAIRAQGLSGVPTWLRSCVNLRYLAIPSYLADFISSGALPDGLTTLELTGDQNARFGEFVHDSIERIVAPSAVAIFSPSVFPQLRHFHSVSDRKRSVLRELRSIGVFLKSATISPYSSCTDLSLLLEENLGYLRLVGGGASSLEGISRFCWLTSVHLHDLPRLASIRGLTDLPRLQDLSVGYCAGIRDVTAIARVATLRRLSFYGCDKLLSASDITRFEKMNLESLSL
jgi:hypothetical protein